MTSAHDVAARLKRQIDDLPVLPTVVGRLMALDRDDESYFASVLGLIESDPTYAARLVAAANSALSSPRSPVTSVRAALNRLGSGGAANTILSLSISRVFVPRDPWEKSLWRHAIQVATTTRALVSAAGEIGIGVDEAYTAGLLHDVGRFVMFEHAPEALRQVDEGDWDSAEELVATELAICGLSHSQLGALACEHWGLPDLLGHAVAHHHDADVDSAGGPHQAITALVQFADLAMFPSQLPGTAGFDQMPLSTIEDQLIPHLPAILSLTPEHLQKIISDSCAEANVACMSLGLT